MRLKNLALLVSSYEGANDLWPVFIELFNKNNNKLQNSIYVSTTSVDKDVTTLYYDETLGVNILNVGEDISWADNLWKALEMIQEDYVLLMLDDFFLTDKIDIESLSMAMTLLDTKRYMNGIYLYDIMHTSGDFVKWKGKQTELELLKAARNMPYRINAQACIWRRQFLQALCLPGLDAWEFEILHSRFSQRIEFNLYYTENTIIPYKHGIEKGRWLPQGVEILNKNNIDVDFSKRGFFTLLSTTNKRKKFRIASLFPKFFTQIYLDFKWRKEFALLKSRLGELRVTEYH